MREIVNETDDRAILLTCDGRGKDAKAAALKRLIDAKLEQQSQFWQDCMRDVILDKDRQIARLQLSQ